MAQIDPIEEDFRNFLFLVHLLLNLPPPTPLQYDIAYYLQHGPKRCVIEAFRGIGKSHITAAFVCWLLYCNPALNILVVSASKDRSDAFTVFTKRLIAEMDILAHLRPRAGCRDSMVAFDVGPAANSQSPSVKAAGITGQITGSRADIIIADDIEVPNNSMTDTQRRQLAERVKEFDAILKPLPTSRVIYLGTPQTEMSLYNELPERGYEIRVWPARIPANPDNYKGNLAPIVMRMIEDGLPAGDPADTRFNAEELREREVSYARSGFALQFMLDTTMSDADRYPLKMRDMIVTSLDPRMAPASLVWCNDIEKVHADLPSVGLKGDQLYRPMWRAEQMAEYGGAVMAIDPSGNGQDETAYAVVKILHGNLFLVAAGGFPEGYSEATLRGLAVIAKTHSVNRVIVEANFGDGMFSQLLKPVLAKLHPVTVEEVKHSTQKERRICDTLEPLLNAHRLVVDTAVIRKDAETPDTKKQLFYQLTRVTREKGALRHDDRLDALAIAVSYWTEYMARDTNKAAEEHLERLRDAELRKFMDAALGGTREEQRWMSV